VRCRNHRHARPPPFLFPSARASQLRQLSTAFNPQPFPLPLTPFTPGRSAGHLWQVAGRRVLSSPLSLRLYLKPSSSSRSPLCTCFAPTHPPEHCIHPSAAALSPPPPLGKLVDGEGLPLLSLSSSLMFLPALTEPIVPQVHVPDVLRSCAPITPDRRRSWTSSPSPPLRPRARPITPDRRATPVSGALATAPRTRKSWAMRSVADGQDRVPLRVLCSVHCGLVSRDHGSVHGFLSRWIKDPCLSRATFL
jgi:hypothetical protein